MQSSPFNAVASRLIGLVLMIALAGCALFAINVDTASAAPSAATVNAAYKEKAAELKAIDDGRGLRCKYADLDGNGVKEMICNYSGRQYAIYTYKSGKVKPLLETTSYGWDKIRYSKKSNSFRLHRYGHGGEAYEYYVLRNGVYKQVAEKARSTENGNAPWYYYDGIKSLSKSAFDKKIAKLQKGKLATVNM